MLPVGPDALLAEHLVDVDPPPAAQLTNAIGAVLDHLDDVIRLQPDVADATAVTIRGADPWQMAVVERGGPIAEPEVRIARDDAEDVFRTLATERRVDRLHNPGLDPTEVDRIVATCCVIVGVLRKLRLDAVSMRPGARS